VSDVGVDRRPWSPAWAGLGHVLLVFVGSAVVAGVAGVGRHSLDASVADVSTWAADADPTRVWVGEWIAALGWLLFLVFAPLVRQGATAAAFAAAYVILALAGTASLAPALNRDDATTAAAVLDLRTTLYLLAFLAFGAWALSAGLAALRGRTLPRGLAWAAVAIGALHLALAPLATVDLAFTGLPTFAGFLWIAVTSVVLARRPRS
jgi:hypothetical protein